MNQRLEAVERWAKEVKTSRGKWKNTHTEFINAQFEKNYAFLKKLAQQEKGKEKIIELYAIKNRKGYPALLKE